MTNAPLDVVVIGGGIHGAGVAQAAAASGYRVLVLEQSQIAAGTSSRSSKLIHGGLRYLEQAQLHLVHECLRERALLLKNAPELVRLVPFHIPVYRESKRASATIALGLSLYYGLGGFGAANRFSRVPRSQWDTLDGIETKGLRAVYRYFDGQTDDRALTQAVMNSAFSLGAELRMPARFERADIAGDEVKVFFQHKGRSAEVTTRVVVNAAGPWVNDVLKQVTPATAALQIKRVQGSHILVAGNITRGIYYLEAPQDRRPVFVMPWHEDTIMVGTTEKLFDGDPAQVYASVEEKTYLLETLSAYFPRYHSAEAARIKDAFAGLRVLPSGPSNLNALPRDTTLHVDRSDRPRILTIYGGKLTAYRATAEAIMKRLSPSLPAPAKAVSTTTLPLKRGPLRYAL